jgi:hypothetical protein
MTAPVGVWNGAEPLDSVTLLASRPPAGFPIRPYVVPPFSEKRNRMHCVWRQGRLLRSRDGIPRVSHVTDNLPVDREERTIDDGRGGFRVQGFVFDANFDMPSIVRCARLRFELLFGLARLRKYQSKVATTDLNRKALSRWLE